MDTELDEQITAMEVFMTENKAPLDIIQKLKENQITLDLFSELNETSFVTMGITLLRDQLIMSKLITKQKAMENQKTDMLSYSLDELSCSILNSSNTVVSLMDIPFTSINKALQENLEGQLTGEAKDLSEIYKKNGDLTSYERKRFLRVLMKYFTEKHGHYNNLIELKNFATSVVNTWPKLGVSIINEKEETEISIDHLFSLGGPQNKPYGSLYFILQNMRRRLLPEKKKYKPKNKDMVNIPNKKRKTILSPIKSEEERKNQESQKSQLLNMSASDKSSILNQMEKTVKLRRELVLDPNNSLKQLFDEYPFYKEYNGELVSRDFQHLTGTREDENFVDIKKYSAFFNEKCNFKDVFSQIFDENLKVLIGLSNFLQTRNVKKKNRYSDENGSINPALLKIVDENKSIESIIEKNNIKQPHLILFGDINIGGNYAVLIEDNYIYVGTDAIMAFRILFKSFFVFNLEYEKTLRHFYDFIDKNFFNKEVKLISPKAIKLHSDFKQLIDNVIF